MAGIVLSRSLGARATSVMINRAWNRMMKTGPTTPPLPEDPNAPKPQEPQAQNHFPRDPDAPQSPQTHSHSHPTSKDAPKPRTLEDLLRNDGWPGEDSEPELEPNEEEGGWLEKARNQAMRAIKGFASRWGPTGEQAPPEGAPPGKEALPEGDQPGQQAMPDSGEPPEDWPN